MEEKQEEHHSFIFAVDVSYVVSSIFIQYERTWRRIKHDIWYFVKKKTKMDEEERKTQMNEEKKR